MPRRWKYIVFMAFDTPEFDLGGRGLDLAVDSIINSCVVLGTLFNLHMYIFCLFMS